MEAVSAYTGCTMIARLLLLLLISLGMVFVLAGWQALDRAEQRRLYTTPQLLSPAGSEVVATAQPLLRWRNPTGAGYYELKLTPLSRRASTIHMYGASVSSYQVPAPPQWCCLEPDTLYSWQVRVSFAEEPA